MYIFSVFIDNQVQHSAVNNGAKSPRVPTLSLWSNSSTETTIQGRKVAALWVWWLDVTTDYNIKHSPPCTGSEAWCRAGYRTGRSAAGLSADIHLQRIKVKGQTQESEADRWCFCHCRMSETGSELYVKSITTLQSSCSVSYIQLITLTMRSCWNNLIISSVWKAQKIPLKSFDWLQHLV